MLRLMLTQLEQRCKKHDTLITFEYREKMPRNELLQAVSEFVNTRNQINESEVSLRKGLKVVPNLNILRILLFYIYIGKNFVITGFTGETLCSVQIDSA